MSTEAQKVNELASEISSSMDNGFSEILNMLHGMNAAAEYITCLRQVVYARHPEVIINARANLDRLGSKWTTYADFVETRMKQPEQPVTGRQSRRG